MSAGCIDGLHKSGNVIRVKYQSFFVCYPPPKLEREFKISRYIIRPFFNGPGLRYPVKGGIYFDTAEQRGVITKSAFLFKFQRIMLLIRNGQDKPTDARVIVNR